MVNEEQSFILDQNSMSGCWHLMGGTFDTPDGENHKIVTCPEGIHPVIFKVERYQESSDR